MATGFIQSSQIQPQLVQPLTESATSNKQVAMSRWRAVLVCQYYPRLCNSYGGKEKPRHRWLPWRGLWVTLQPVLGAALAGLTRPHSAIHSLGGEASRAKILEMLRARHTRKAPTSDGWPGLARYVVKEG
jgi:hypothetical protein